MLSYFYGLSNAINVKYAGIRQQTSPMTMLVALDVKVTMIMNMEIATSNELGLTPIYFYIK